MLTRIKTMSTQFLHWLLPNQCILCHLPGTSATPLCLKCTAQLPFKTFSCQHCAFPLPITHAIRTCGECLNRRWQFERCFCLFHYEREIQKLLIGLKFFDQLINAAVLGHLLCENLVNWYANKTMPQAIIAVPLHPARTRQRGFNQAIEIAKIVARTTGIPLLTSHCKRIKNTEPQSELDKSSRQANLKNAFTVLKPIPHDYIAILDDIFTTGNTVDMLAKTLRTAGVKQIDVWCIARAH